MQGLKNVPEITECYPRTAERRVTSRDIALSIATGGLTVNSNGEAAFLKAVDRRSSRNGGRFGELIGDKLVSWWLLSVWRGRSMLATSTSPRVTALHVWTPSQELRKKAAEGFDIFLFWWKSWYPSRIPWSGLLASQPIFGYPGDTAIPLISTPMY
jgi:hypothetical protein